VDPFKSLLIVDSQRMWWYGFTKDMKRRRECGESLAESVRSLENYVLSAIQSLHGMGKAGVFRSKTIAQMQEILDTMEFVEVCVTDDDSIRKQMEERASVVSPSRAYDSVYTSWDAFMYFFAEINNSFRLNPANLVCCVELMVSMLLHKFGGTNDTW
jgi:hypothetical protein